MPGRFRLAVREGALAGESFAVDGELCLGRVEADVTIEDDEVSRRHTVIRPKDGELEIEDLGSLNGTYVNGERLEAVKILRPGDVIRIGKTSIAVEVESGGGPKTLAAEPKAAAQRTAAPAEAAPAPQVAARVPAPLAAPPPPSTFAPPPVRRRRRAATRSAFGIYLTFGVIVANALALVVYFATTG